ncbi:hypothetical protein M0802_015553 [Mischocyttarus mexicanus]|nr:hypothetical protein M0802_015553 [Mischocyttarus mexicanus]
MTIWIGGGVLGLVEEAGGVMAGSVATLAILWISLQSMGLLSYTKSMEAYKLPVSLQNYLTSYTGKYFLFFYL